MGIDGIGKGRGLPPEPATGGTSAPKAAGSEDAAPFRVERGQPTAIDGAAAGEGAERAERADARSAVDPSSALSRLRAGDVDVNGYMDLRVDEATRGLEGLPPSDLAEVKRVLRDQLASDPGLAELVARATGTAPTPPTED